LQEIHVNSILRYCYAVQLRYELLKSIQNEENQHCNCGFRSSDDPTSSMIGNMHLTGTKCIALSYTLEWVLNQVSNDWAFVSPISP
jgi:hypothetical protein